MSATEFDYKVRDASGRFREGRVKADSEAAVAEKLMSMGYVPLEVKAAGGGLQREITLGRGKRVGMKDLSIFARQLSTMIDAGLTLMRALAILGDQMDNARLRESLAEVRQQVESGHSLSSAFAQDPQTYPPFMINMTKAGEAGGFLDVAMRQLAETFESEVKLRSRVKSAMTYPIVIFVMAMLMCIGMLIFIVPIFEEMFADLGGALPLPTQVLVTISGLLPVLLPGVAVVGVAGLVWWRRHGADDKVRAVVDPLKLKLPVFGPLFAKIALARFSRNLGTLLKSGVPILTALEVVSDTTGSWVIGRAIDDVAVSVAQGETISGPLARHGVFPPMVVQMIASGEEAGAVDSMLHRISEFYDEEVTATTEAMTALIEPLMIAFLGVVVGGMILSLYMPMFSIFDMIE